VRSARDAPEGGGALQMSSINEDFLLAQLGLPRTERNLIEGLQTRRISSAGANSGFGLTEEQISSRAVARLTADPSPKVGQLQRCTAKRLVRPYPLGLRFSGKNMSPLPGWLAGCQSITLNMSNIDLALQLHYSLFRGSEGYLLKPQEMRKATEPSAVSGAQDAPDENIDDYWPPPRERLHRATIEVLSLHQLPKRHEGRPRFDGSHRACHNFVPKLSGVFSPPNRLAPSSAAIKISLHTIGGFCAVSKSRTPPHHNVEAELDLLPKSNGLYATFGAVVHCFAAEPRATFLRIGVADHGTEVAFATAVVGRLKRGWRVFQLRSHFGTRIELCYLFVNISFGSEPNMFFSPRQLRIQTLKLEHELAELRARLGSSGRRVMDVD